MPRCGSRRRKLVERNRFITREMERAGGTGREGQREEKRAEMAHEHFVDAAFSSFLPFLFCVYYIYIYMHLMYLLSSFVPSCLASSSLRRGRFISPCTEYVNKERSRDTPSTLSSFLQHTAAKSYSTISLSLSLSHLASSTSCLLYRNLVRSSLRAPRVCIRQSRSIRMT